MLGSGDMAKRKSAGVDRRNFLSAAVTASAATVAASSTEAAERAKPARGLPAPSAAQQLAETAEPKAASHAGSSHPNDSGSDFMVDAIKTLGIDYVFSNPGSSFLGLHESIVNYGGNKAPEFITCMHEESSAAMANGYYKAALKPAAMLCHGTVGLQHAAMGLYNAWCDRVPLIAILGNTIDGMHRAGANDWRHSAQDPAAMVRDFTKWDDQPTSLQGFAESLIQGYKISTTPPMEPIALVVDSELQEMELHDRAALRIPKFSPTIPPQGDANALREAAQLLVNAERPVIIADRLARTQAGMDNLVILAELLNAPVIDLTSRQNMPTTHYLFQNAQRRPLINNADVILGLEVTDFWGQVTQFSRDDIRGTPRYKTGTKLIRIGSNDLFMRSNYQDFQRYAPVDLSIAGDGEASLPALIEAVRGALSDNRRSAITGRTENFKKMHASNLQAAREAAAYGWDASPVSTARLCMELWQLIKNEDWALVSVGASENFISNWPHRLWKIEKQYQYLGYGAGGGVGYGLPAAVGAALANKALGRFSVNIQCDGDFMYANGALWTAAHHNIPLLTVMHNNRAYAQETMLLQGIANKRHRGVTTANIGTEITNPNIDYAKLAEGMGVWSAGPITDPADLAPALKRAIAVVKQGQPALVDVVTQSR
jgi:thiamine pyrophosphate-dependent acetolactate synthase large subunit-like protein